MTQREEPKRYLPYYNSAEPDNEMYEDLNGDYVEYADWQAAYAAGQIAALEAATVRCKTHVQPWVEVELRKMADELREGKK